MRCAQRCDCRRRQNSSKCRHSTRCYEDASSSFASAAAGGAHSKHDSSRHSVAYEPAAVDVVDQALARMRCMWKEDAAARDHSYHAFLGLRSHLPASRSHRAHIQSSRPAEANDAIIVSNDSPEASRSLSFRISTSMALQAARRVHKFGAAVICVWTSGIALLLINCASSGLCKQRATSAAMRTARDQVRASSVA